MLLASPFVAQHVTQHNSLLPLQTLKCFSASIENVQNRASYLQSRCNAVELLTVCPFKHYKFLSYNNVYFNYSV